MLAFLGGRCVSRARFPVSFASHRILLHHRAHCCVIIGRVVVDSILSLDGYFAGPKNEIDWFLFDEESLEWSWEILRSAGTIPFGLLTYEMTAAYWPTATPKDKEPFISSKLTELPKIVFSGTLKKAEWNNSSVVSRPPREVVAKLKQGPGGDIVIVGSSSVVPPLVKDGLVDEYKIRIQPIILGKGRPYLSMKAPATL